MKILIVDDDRRMVKTIFDILTVKGYEPVAAYTGEEALLKIESEKPECVLMDIKMPGINGVEALKKINDLSPDLPVILMSAYATEEQIEDARQHGAYTVLNKPIDIQIVLSFLTLLRKEESILIVDDDPNFCKTIKDILKTRSYKVITEPDPDKVLDHMEQTYMLTVLLDLKLGDQDGVEILKTIRAKYPSKPVVLVTGLREDMTPSVEKGLKIGAYTCFYKPFEVESLIDTIKEISRKKLQAFLGEPF
jgi:two-component system, NtrC family, response regulator HydG